MKKPEKVIEIVSTANPSGVTFLLNILVELRYLIYTTKFEHFWRQESEGQASVNPLLKKKFSIWMPALLKWDSFKIREPIFYWSHEWPRPQPRNVKRVLFVRDPRDALFSQFKRLASKDRILDFLHKKSQPFDLDRMDKWALQNLLWVDLSRPDDFLILRFEDVKSNPIAELKKFFKFCGIEVPEADLLKAIDESSTEKVKDTHDKIQKQYDPGLKNSQVVIRKGQTFEWKSSPDRADLTAYSSLGVLTAIEKFGYDLPMTTSPAKVPVSGSSAKAISQLYGRNFNFSAEQISKMEKTLDIFPISESSISFLNLFPLVKKNQMRLLVFRIGISLATTGWMFCRLVFPPGSRWVEKVIVNYSLGES